MMSARSLEGKKRGHRRAQTTVPNFSNDLAELHLEEEDEQEDSIRRLRRSSIRVQHLKDVSSGNKDSSPIVRRKIEEISIRTGAQFYDVIAKWEELVILKNGDMQVDMFVDAYKQILYVLDAFGSVFGIIKQDLKSQMAKTKEQCTRYGVDTLQKMADIDGKNGKGTQSLIWLKRTLQFTEVMLTKMLTGIALPEAVDYAYHNTLIYAHPFVVRAIAKNIRFATPDTQTFLSRIYKPDTQLVSLGIAEFLISLRPRMVALVSFFNKRKYEDHKPLQSLPEAVNKVNSK
ncbi:hypothetical protein NDN08_004801 [Rhodosorus marinus]|uniref:Glycolipid transfer protein domain-containing protein n=1 Tax=Rhodosorus marinus TaxID=101924 RepID=A0AAV8UMB0_9RHOD|nr:hypothetical protein NDN08_004801 [Rhodosorus marinus]